MKLNHPPSQNRQAIRKIVLIVVFALLTMAMMVGSVYAGNFQPTNHCNRIALSPGETLPEDCYGPQENYQEPVEFDKLDIVATPLLAPGEITGKAFRDHNASGTQDNAEAGLSGVLVFAIDGNGTTASTTTTSTGAFTIAAGAGLTGKVRLEFTLPTGGTYDYLESGASGGTTVQFVDVTTGATNVAVGFNSPAEYCQNNPDLTTSCFLYGSQTALSGDVLVHFDYDAGCLDSNRDGVCESGGTSYDTPLPTHMASGSQIGSTYGLAYEREADTLFAASFMKRHSGFRTFGATGVIYKIANASTGTPSTPVSYVDLDALGFDTGTDPHPTTAGGDWAHDPASWDQVGKMSLGDLDISDDEKTLYTINLFSRKLLAIPVTTSLPLVASDITAINLPDPGNGATGCPAHASTPSGQLNYNVRPFAVAYREGKVYVGMTCTAESNATVSNLRIFVYSYDGATFTQVLNNSINYTRGSAAPSASANWHRWSTTFQATATGFPGEYVYPQPWLTDIEFNNGQMVLGIRDRYGDQTGVQVNNTTPGSTTLYSGDSAGDILRACTTSGTTWTLESAGSCGGVTTSGSGNNQGPGGGEFYYHEDYPAPHHEISLAGLVQVPGHDSIVTTVYDPIFNNNEYFDGGVIWLNNQTGQRTNAYRLYNTTVVGTTFAKGGGLGDLEAFCQAAPIEVGNRVWNDTDGDGIQDPSESGISGVNVTLTCGANSVSVVTASDNGATPANEAGQFLFSTATNATWMDAGEACTISIDKTQGALTGLNLTTPNNPDSGASDGGANSDARDSNATTNGNNAEIDFTAGGAGENNHTYDVGFTSVVIADLDFGDLPDGDGTGVSYPTNTTDGGEGVGASHIIDGSTYLGNCVDSETDGQPDVEAGVDGTDGDDGNAGNTTTGSCTIANDDEDGISFITPLTPGGIGCIEAIASASSILNGWIDFDGNGTLSAGEQVLSDVALGSGTNTPASISASDGLCFAIPTGTASAGIFLDAALYSRFRLTANTGEGGDSPAGAASTGEVEDYFSELGAIGNYVWLDENSDGYQDAGEMGIPNVRLILRNAGGTIIATTYTDAAGGYLFPNLPAGDYFVDVDETTIPNGMSQTTIKTNPNGDFGNQDHITDINGYPVSIGNGQPLENLTADFGYNYNPTNDVNLPLGSPTAALGDHVWFDADNDGKQDPNEIGIPNVCLELFGPGPDGVFDPGVDGIYGTGDDDSVATDDPSQGGIQPYTATTDSNGNYIFDGLTPDAYVVQVCTTNPALTGYTQTGDPDHFGQTDVAPLANDGITTAPVILGPGDVYLDADFGYSAGASCNQLGDLVFFDAAANGSFDGSDYGITGVTVALIKDTNNDGIWDADGVNNIPGDSDDEPIIGTDSTDSSGNYLFPCLLDGNYITWVNDTDNVLGELGQSSEPDNATNNGQTCANCNNMNAVSISGADNFNQDYGYTPQGNSIGDGAIGDTIWLNYDGLDNGQQADEPGIEGVVVTLTDSNGNVSVTETDENGHYYFGGLDPNGTYTVSVSAENFLAGGALQGLENTDAPDTSPPGTTQTVVDLSSSGPLDMTEDFGFTPPSGEAGSVGNLVWLDLNADSDYDGAGAGETPIGGVTIDLYRDPNCNGLVDAGEGLFGSMVTDASINAGTFGTDGNYLFSNLPTNDGSGGGADVCYVIDVTDVDGVLAGYWHSLSGLQGSNNTSKTDPFGVAISSGTPDNLIGDFGYYIDPAKIGNFVWFDTNGDGIQDSGEAGIDGITINLDIEYNDGTTITLMTVTGDDPSTVAVETGWYSFCNLLLDEDYAVGSASSTPSSNNPAYVLSMDVPPGYASTLININTGGGTDQNDADDTAGVTAIPTQGNQNVVQNSDPTAESDPVAAYDFGVVDGIAVGNIIWDDSVGQDGIFDDLNEVGIDNVIVELYKAGDIPGTSTPVMTTTTAGGGFYLFENLISGMGYFISVKTAQPALADFETSSPGGNNDPLLTDEDFTGGVGTGDDGTIATFGGMSYAVTRVFTPTRGAQSALLQAEDANAPGWNDADDFLVVDFGFINDDSSPTALRLAETTLTATTTSWLVWVTFSVILLFTLFNMFVQYRKERYM